MHVMYMREVGGGGGDIGIILDISQGFHAERFISKTTVPVYPSPINNVDKSLARARNRSESWASKMEIQEI